MRNLSRNKIFKKLLAAMLMLAASALFLVSPMAVPLGKAASVDSMRPEQITVTVTGTPQTSMHVNFVSSVPGIQYARIVVNKKGEQAERIFPAFRKADVKDYKTFWYGQLTGLVPDTEYEFVCIVYEDEASHTAHPSEKHSFFTAKPVGDEEEFSFIYMTDPQILGSAGKAFAATTEYAKQIAPNARFLYIAGDFTNNKIYDSQWETFFNVQNPLADQSIEQSYYNSVMPGKISDFAVVGAIGNHDYNLLGNYFTFDSLDANNSVVYSFDYGMLKMIVLNNGLIDFSDAQIAFLEQEIAEAKSRKQWTAVAFHRAIYSGGRHVVSDDIVNIRKQYSPLFAELDIDVVLQGHDHVFSRGQVTASGTKANGHLKLGNRRYTAAKANNAPLYYVGGCATTVSFNPTVNYTPAPGDPLAADYAFLDLNSARNAGHAQNPDGPNSHNTFDPVFTVVTVSGGFVRFDAYMYDANVNTDVYSQPYLYDSYTITRSSEESETISVSELGDDWHYYGKTDSGLFADAFDATELDGWGMAASAVGFGSPKVGSGLRLASVIEAGAGSRQRGEELFTATYFKKAFTLPENFDSRQFGGFWGTHRIGGGAMIMYVNGCEVYRFNANNQATTDENCRIGVPVRFDSYMGKRITAEDRNFSIMYDYGAHDTGFTSADPASGNLMSAGSLTSLKSALRPGDNIVTCIVFQRAAANNTLWFDLGAQALILH